MDEDIEKELILSKLDFAISKVRDNPELVELLKNIELMVKEY